MKKAIMVLFLSQIVLFGILGCSSGSKSIQKDNIKSNIEFSIIIGSGGGFTGLYEGYWIDSLSKVYKWNGKTFESAEKVFLDDLSNEQTEQINKDMKETNILNTELKEHGNLSSYIIFENKATKHSVSWSGIEPGNKTPENVRSFYSRLVKILDSLQKK